MIFSRILLTGGCLLLLCSEAFCAVPLEWTDKQIRLLRSLNLDQLGLKPTDRSNRYAHHPVAQRLGEKLFFDPRFSRHKKISCSSCHQPDNYFADSLPVAQGLEAGGRNTPSIIGSAWQRWFYWDGRKDSLWAQALSPLEAEAEMGGDRLSIVRDFINEPHYRQAYTYLVGSTESLLNRLPLVDKASPQSRDKILQGNWRSLRVQDQNFINQVFSNIGKMLAAYESTLRPASNRLDHYINQLVSGVDTNKLLNDDELLGLALFIDPKNACLNCHNGPLLTNKEFHNIGSGRFNHQALDFGRFLGLQTVLMGEFNCFSQYSDIEPNACHHLRFLNKTEHIDRMNGAFKVPSLRNVAKTGPYFHDGRFSTLELVVQYYNNPPKTNGLHELKSLGLNSQQIKQLVAFLKTL